MRDQESRTDRAGIEGSNVEGSSVETSAETRRVADLTLAEKVGQLFQVGFHGTEATDTIRELIEEYHAGGVIYFSRNVETAAQTARLSEALQDAAIEATGIPLLLSTDQEGGVVTRIPFGTVPLGQMALGATGDTDLACELGAAVGEQLRAVGVNTNFAPVLDVNNNPDNPVIGVRSFGSDPEMVGELGSAVADGLQGTGVAACGKHFPGHGDTTVDSHAEMPTVGHDRERLDQVELPPFEAAIESGIDAIMTAHVNFPAIEPDSDTPATLSANVLTGLLREELGYDGVVITDCMEMNAIAGGVGTVQGAVETIRAGADAVLVSHTAERQRDAIEAVIDAVESGDLPESRIDEAARRVLALKRNRLAPAESTRPEDANNQLLATANRIASQAITLVRDDADLVPLSEDATAFVWEFPTERASPAEDAESDRELLAARLADEPIEMRQHVFEFEDADGDYDGAHAVDADDRQPDDPTPALPEVGENEVVIACTFDANGNPAQADVVRRAIQAGHRVIVLALRNPYDLGAIPEAPTFLTTYDHSPLMIAAAGDVLLGREEARGTLPIDLS